VKPSNVVMGRKKEATSPSLLDQMSLHAKKTGQTIAKIETLHKRKLCSQT